MSQEGEMPAGEHGACIPGDPAGWGASRRRWCGPLWDREGGRSPCRCLRLRPSQRRTRPPPARRRRPRRPHGRARRAPPPPLELRRLNHPKLALAVERSHKEGGGTRGGGGGSSNEVLRWSAAACEPPGNSRTGEKGQMGELFFGIIFAVVGLCFCPCLWYSMIKVDYKQGNNGTVIFIHDWLYKYIGIKYDSSWRQDFWKATSGSFGGIVGCHS